MFLKEHDDVRGKIENLLRKKMNIPSPGAANGRPAPAAQAEKPAEKPAIQAAAAAATAAAGRPRPVK
jgi:hypothetical protein